MPVELILWAEFLLKYIYMSKNTLRKNIPGINFKGLVMQSCNIFFLLEEHFKCPPSLSHNNYQPTGTQAITCFLRSEAS